MTQKAKFSGATSVEFPDSEIADALEWLARAAIAAGMDAGSFLKVTRKAVASAGRPVATEKNRRAKHSYSQISAVTGLPRKDLPNLLDTSFVNDVLSMSPVWSIAIHWGESKDLRNSRGVAAPLELVEGKNSFKALVARLFPDVPHMAVLKEMVRLGIVERLGKKILLSRDYKLRMKVEADRLVVSSKKAKHFLRSSYLSQRAGGRLELNELAILSGLPENMVALFLRHFSERARSLMTAVEKWEAAYLPEKSSRNGDEIVGIGVYTFRETSSEDFVAPAVREPIRKPTRRAKRA